MQSSRAGALLQSQLRKLSFDRIVYVVFAELAGDANGILNRIRIRPAMTDNGNSLDAKQRSAAEFGIIQTPLERAKRVLRENSADLCRKSAVQFLAEHFDERFEQSFAEFQRDVSRETIADNHVDITFEDVSTFDVANEIDGSKPQGFECFLRQLVPFRVFFTDGEQTDARSPNAEDRAGVNIAHYGELFEMHRLAIHVGTNIEQNGGLTFLGWKNR